MSRIIKFRIWHGGKMWYDDTTTPDGNEVSLHFYNSKSNNIGWGLYDNFFCNRIVTGDPDAIFNTPGILMQFTGLLDKNGKEIYEGDILLFWKGFNETYREYTGEVKWHQQSGSWYVLCGKFYQDIVGFAQSGDGEKVNLDNAEIIGNIYETPSLIKLK